jgi:hypothetical protein
MGIIRALVIVAFLPTGGCAGASEMLRRADVPKLMRSASGEVDRAAKATDMAADLIDLGCAIRETPECRDARLVLGKANDAIAKARAALKEASDRHDRYWFAADMVENAVVAGAEALTAARKVVGR